MALSSCPSSSHPAYGGMGISRIQGDATNPVILLETVVLPVSLDTPHCRGPVLKRTQGRNPDDRSGVRVFLR